MSIMQPEKSQDISAERLVMVGGVVPKDVMNALLKVDPIPQVQTYKLSWAVVDGIEHTGRIVDLISTVPISDYPKSKWIFSGYRKWDRSNGSDNWILPFINILGWKQFTRFLSCVVALLWWAIAHRKEKRHVLLYGLISPHLYAVLFIRLFFSMKLTVLITDLPGLTTRFEKWWRRIVRPIDNYLVYRAIPKMDGLIVLTRQIAIHCAPELPAIVVEGIISAETETMAIASDEKRDHTDEFVILYAGGLQENYGIPLLLDAFAKLPGDGFRLWLFGGGDMEDEIRSRAQKDPRISFPGLIPPEEVFHRSQQATVLINPRPAHECFAPYSFPSKQLEYMAAGRPVVTTRLSGIPKEYDPYLIWIDNETPDALAELFLKLRDQPPEELDSLGRRAQEFVLQEKNLRRQGKRVADFIQYINSLTKGKY
jgi:glycosyltransferase involved in cell wall biosynthesis